MEPQAEAVLERIAAHCRAVFEENLVGIYVHGSLAFGCFNWDKSDIDFIVVTRDAPRLAEKEAFIGGLLALGPLCPEKGLETSVVLERDCRDFTYPTPYALHYSNAHRRACADDLRGYCMRMHGTDKDLAAHFTVIEKAGITLCGKPKEEVFGHVPAEDYLDSIRYDMEHAADGIAENPVYMILNLCRALAFIRDGAVLSKRQGADWGRLHLPPRYAPLIGQAEKCYASAAQFSPAGAEALLYEFAAYMTERILHSESA